MVKVSYDFAPVTSVLRINSSVAGNQSHSDVTRIGGTAGGFFVAFNTSVGANVDGRSFSEDGHALSREFMVNSVQSGYQVKPAAVALSNGTIVTAYDDHSKVDSDQWKVRGDLLGPTGQNNREFFLDRGYEYRGTYYGASKPDIAQMKGGGFVIGWSKNFSETANLFAQRFNASGEKIGHEIEIQPPPLSMAFPGPLSVAGLAKGGFVAVGYTGSVAKWPVYYFQRFSANGTALDKTAQVIPVYDNNKEVYGSDGSITVIRDYIDIKVANLRDGGFAVAYGDISAAKDKDIFVRIYNADGTARTDALAVGTQSKNLNDPTASQPGDQNHPNITTLSNGAIAVSWTNHAATDDIQGRVLDEQGHALTKVVNLSASASWGETESSLAGLSGGKLVATWTTDHEAGTNTTGIQGREFQLTRTITGDNSSEVLKGDSLPDMIFGNGGNDMITGQSGNDTLYGGAGNDFFVFDVKPGKTNYDKIGDFSVEDDSIYLSHKVFAGLGQKGSLAQPVKLSASAFWTGAKAHDASDRIIYDSKTGVLYYDPDGNGSAAAVKIAALSKGLHMTEKDFFIV